MNIVGLEVIKSKPQYLCECIECGYFFESAEHCRSILCPRCGGQMRRAERPGPGQPASLEVAPPGKLELTYGNTMRLSVHFEYRGPAMPVTLYGSIGKKGLIYFDEIIVCEHVFDLPASNMDFSPVDASVDIPIGSGIDAGTNYDLMAKVKEYSGQTETRVLDVIDIVGIPPTFILIHEETYPFAYIYDGETIKTIMEGKTEPWASTNWPGKGDQLAADLQEEIKNAGGHILSLKVYADKTPLFWTDWRIEVDWVDVSGGSTSGIALAPVIIAIIPIIVKVLGLALIIWLLTVLVDHVAAIFKHNPALEQVKPAWSKETLIATIQEAEEYWERPITPTESLQAMGEEDLRIYLDDIAKAEIPAGIPWAALAIGAGVAVLCIGYAATRKGKEKKK